MMVDVQALIAKARAANSRAAEENWIEVSTLFGDEFVAVRFDAILGSRWAALTAGKPPREDIRGDSYYGFNTDDVVRDYPSSAISIEGERIPEDAWREIFAEMDAPTRTNCVSAVWALNQYGPAARIAQAKKAMAGASEKKPN